QQTMLDRLRQNLADEPEAVRQRVTLYQGDMRSFELGRRYGVIQIPYRAFLHNLTRADQLACLERCRAHLAPSGMLAFNLFHPSLRFMANNHDAFAGLW